MKRSKHSLSHYKLVTCDMGRLIPVGLLEALPGDTFQHSTSMLVRLSPLMAPVMHPVSVRIHHWFVPNRLVFSQWEDFITGGKDGLGNGAVYPTNLGAVNNTAGSLLDYMGVPIKNFAVGQLNAMPVRAFNKIYNEFYRDEDLAAERGPDDPTVPKIAWEKDYFTAARPWTQKGPNITLPIGAKAPIIFKPATNQYVRDTVNRNVIANATSMTTDATGILRTQPGTVAAYLDPISMEADLASANPPDIIQVRRAFALMRYQEARAQYGSRYTEYLRYLGVRSSDARLQRPQYLGGGKQTIAFSEVLRTGTSADETANPVGQMKGHGIAAMRSNRYRYFCEEHGYILSLLSIRPRSMYNDGLERTWSRRTKEDYYQKELELIGQQEVKNQEVYVQGTAADSQIFGYQDRYSEYRHQYSSIAGDFRSTLDHWHLARKFASLPVLNQSFIECDPAKRIFAEQTKHSMWIMVSHSVQCRRMVGKNTIGRVI